MNTQPDPEDGPSDSRLDELRAIRAEIGGLREDMRTMWLWRSPIATISVGVVIGMVISMMLAAFA